MRRVCIAITARPSYSRVKTVLQALQKRPDVELQVIAAGSALIRRTGRVVDQINADGFPVVAEIPSVVEGGTTREGALATGLLLTQMAATLERLRPDVVVTIADRHETLATAVAASYQNITLCHIQGGEVSGSIDDKVRNAVTCLAEVHCVATQRAGVNVEALRGAYGPEGYSRGLGVYITGCPGIDLAAEAIRLGPLNKAQEIVVLQHPDTTHEHEAAAQIGETIKAIRPYADRALWFWPGEDAGDDAMSKELRMNGIRPIRNMEPVEFLRLLLGCKVLVGNSSVGIRECSFMGVPAVNVGDRQKGRERGPNVLDVPYDSAEIRMAVSKSIDLGMDAPCHLYGDGHAGERIAAILAGKASEAAA